jgi:predicted DNA-binding transcriptional regulator AlpA
MRPSDRLTTAEVAALVGISPVTWRGYVSHQMPRGNPAPKPDGEIDGRTPYWLRSTITAWMARRAGQGARTDLPSKKKRGAR